MDVVNGLSNPVIGDSVLRDVICSDFFRSSFGANLLQENTLVYRKKKTDRLHRKHKYLALVVFIFQLFRNKLKTDLSLIFHEYIPGVFEPGISYWFLLPVLRCRVLLAVASWLSPCFLSESAPAGIQRLYLKYQSVTRQSNSESYRETTP